ncbi:sce7726 family protein [Nitrincola alkalilacustris]|uniref:sce7726 family protein n=1 Tax=Nitrincola alkalilacustris TaxID=1571224 RepID=UPI00124D10A9|nr:sce7726 family protein [Nitrincola alkalilacustris]
MRETEIKQALTQHLGASSPGVSTVFLEELSLSGGEVRADLVRVEDMHCFEIKSAGDSLKRLVGQGSRYARVFDHITLVTAAKHLEKARPMLPAWWGIIVIPESQGKPFKQIRKARANKRHEPEVLATLLNREEALSILNDKGITRGFKSKSLYVIQAKVAEVLSLSELRINVQKCLLSRNNR